jgi:hypothetical protein
MAHLPAQSRIHLGFRMTRARYGTDFAGHEIFSQESTPQHCNRQAGPVLSWRAEGRHPQSAPII